MLPGFSPMGGVAKVWRPTSWAGPRPSRKSLNCASEESLTPGKMRLNQRGTTICVFRRFQKKRRAKQPVRCGLLTFPLSCSCSCCRLWTPGSPGGSSCCASPPPALSLCSSGSCCVTSYLLLLDARSDTQKRERKRETKDDARLADRSKWPSQ